MRKIKRKRKFNVTTKAQHPDPGPQDVPGTLLCVFFLCEKPTNGRAHYASVCGQRDSERERRGLGGKCKKRKDTRWVTLARQILFFSSLGVVCKEVIGL